MTVTMGITLRPPSRIPSGITAERLALELERR
jgi:hypothetical protein